MTARTLFSLLPRRHPLLRRLVAGQASGVVAAAAMLAVMTLADITGLFRIPDAPAVALVDTFTGFVLPPLALHLYGIALHLLYGGAWAAALTALTRRITWWKPLVLALMLWILAQPGPLLLIGWGPFGITLSPYTPLATLAYHLVYGVVLSWLLVRFERNERARHEA